ncbi:MAG: polyprenyl synthetase family protein [Sphingobacteriia bacterium]|nr:polyprenyl synthetase family protein [Sphingobacteriia bacterium]
MGLENIYEHYRDSLNEVDQVLIKNSTRETELISLISQYVINSGGKRLRPLLTIICADLCGINNKRHINLAGAVEFIHTATLLHDDVVDESKLRRGNPTANHKWDNKACILVGDFLFSQAFQLMVTDGSIRVLDVLSNASAVISEGEVMQLSSIANLNLTFEDYKKVITAKTAELFAASCEIAPLTAPIINEDHVKLMHEFGLNLGIAFQIIDDAIDYQETSKMGKNKGDDFYEGKVTLPLMIIRDECNFDEKTKLQNIFFNHEFTQESLEFIIVLIEKYNVFDKCFNTAKTYMSKCTEILAHFPDSFAKNALKEIIEFTLVRKY